MRQLTDRLVGLARALNKSVQGAKTDTFVEIPAQLLSVAELSGNYKTFGNGANGVDQFDSFRRIDQPTASGLQGGVAVNGPVLTPGLWRITGYFESHFTGTTNAGASNFWGLNDVDGATGAHILANHQLWTLSHAFVAVDVTLAILFRSQVQIQLAATIAGDAVGATISALYKKLI